MATESSAERSNRFWAVRAGIGVAAVIVLAGIGVALLALLGRPAVSLSSGRALVQAHVDGAGTTVTAVRATSGGRPVALARQGAGYVPVTALAQNQAVDVRVTAAPPSWLRWLLGSGVTTSQTLRTPTAAPTRREAVTSSPGQVTLSFDRPVSVIDYRTAGGPGRVLRLSRPSATAR